MAGGARAGSGRKRANIDERRVMVLREQGLSMRAIALRMGVTTATIQWFLNHHAEKKDDERETVVAKSQAKDQ
jgi:transposase